MARSFRMKPNRCLGCGHELIGATNFRGTTRPKPGDATMCIVCGILCIFTDDMGMRLPTAKELAMLQRDRDTQDMLRSHAHIHGMKKQ